LEEYNEAFLAPFDGLKWEMSGVSYGNPFGVRLLELLELEAVELLGDAELEELAERISNLS